MRKSSSRNRNYVPRKTSVCSCWLCGSDIRNYNEIVEVEGELWCSNCNNDMFPNDKELEVRLNEKSKQQKTRK